MPLFHIPLLKNANDQSLVTFTGMNAVVMKSTGSNYHLLLENGERAMARIKGKLRLKGMKTTNPVAVGDKVTVEKGTDNSWLISSLQPRHNYIVRRSINLSKQMHIVAANVDQAMLLITLKKPYTPPGFIDRFLLTAEAYHIPVILVFNKWDAYAQEDLATVEKFISLYEKIGYPCVRYSSVNDDPQMMIDLLKGKTTLISGHSGVGKSTLINSVQPALKLKTTPLSAHHLQGQHTTTFAEMFALDAGGYIVDTPGIKGFGIVEVEKRELSHYFLDMRKLLPDCRFNNCQHIDEPGCAVKDALEKGELALHRYKNYLDVYYNREEDELEQYK